MREKHLVNLTLKKIKSLGILLLILTSTVMTLSFLSVVNAQTIITSIAPPSGNVGTNVTLTANITTPNGQCQILFDGVQLFSKNATGTALAASFIVPHTFEGGHNVTVVDVASTENNTATFTVSPFYSVGPVNLPPSPAQLQENASLTISVNMTGGLSNYTYPNVLVQTPSGNLTKALNNVTTNAVGDYDFNSTYPADFSTGANTNFTGEYEIIFNGTIVNSFFIGLTNSTEYHRGDCVDIKAVDYPSDQSVNVTISGVDVSYSVSPFNVTSDADGVVHTAWNVTSDAPVGSYEVAVTPVPTSKLAANDTQTFSIPGFQTDIFTRNLADQTISNIYIKAHDESADIDYSNVTGPDGVASIMLEKGNNSFEAYFNEVEVGQIINFTVTQETELNITCQLTTLNINVEDAQNISVPFVSIAATYNYTTNLNGNKNETGTQSGETNMTGAVQFSSLLPNIVYFINASRYENEVFNQTFLDLPAEACVNMTILCPTKKLQVQVTDANNKSMADTMVNAEELMGGLIYNNMTDATGTAVLECTFGRYAVKIYQGAVLLNETTLDLFDDLNTTVECPLCGLYVTVDVVDYFGQPIPNANVTCQPSSQNSGLTGSDGTATFSNILGGNLRLVVYLPGQSTPCAATTSYVSANSTIGIKIEKYVMLAGFFVETGQLATAIVIAVAVILALSIEVYRRRRLRSKKSPS